MVHLQDVHGKTLEGGERGVAGAEIVYRDPELGIILVIFGTIALGAYFIRSCAGRMGLVGMVGAIFGTLLFLMVGGVSIFAAPTQGQAILAGVEEYEKLPTMGVGVLLMLMGNVLLGVAVWRSGTLPRWAGALWVAGSALPLLGQVYIILPIGADSTPPIVPTDAVLLVIGGAWMAYSALRRPSSAETVGVQARPGVQ